MRHTAGKLDLIAAKHVDDIKVAGEPRTLDEFEREFEKQFGKGELTIHKVHQLWNSPHLEAIWNELDRQSISRLSKQLTAQM